MTTPAEMSELDARLLRMAQRLDNAGQSPTPSVLAVRDASSLLFLAATEFASLRARLEAAEVMVSDYGKSIEHLQNELSAAREYSGAEIARLWAIEAEAAALRADAERYRWLRDDNAYFPEEIGIRGGKYLDLEIDAARKGHEHGQR